MTTSKWHAVYTKSRSEKKTANRLESLGLEVYCPTYTTLRQWSDRKKKVTLPALPSYVFLKISEKQRYQALQDPGVLNFVYWQGKPALIREEEIARLKAVLGGVKPTDQLEVRSFHPHDKVSIEHGPFQGWEGEVRHANKQGVSILLESLGLVIKVSPADIEKLLR